MWDPSLPLKDRYTKWPAFSRFPVLTKENEKKKHTTANQNQKTINETLTIN